MTRTSEPEFLMLVMMTSFLSLSYQGNFANYRGTPPRVKGFVTVFLPFARGAGRIPALRNHYR